MDPTPQPSTPSRRTRGITRFDLVVLALLASAVVLAMAKNYQASAARDRAEPDIRSVLAAQVEAWNRGDLEGFMAGYWHSDDLTFCSGGDVTKGWQPTLDRYRKRYQAPGSEMGQLQFREVNVDVLTADTALVRGRWALTRSKDTPHGLYTLQVKKFAGGWKVVYDHTSAADK